MFILGSIIGLLVMGLAVDTTAGRSVDEDDDTLDHGNPDSPDDPEGRVEIGTEGSDWLAGGDGDDRLEGGDGNDDLHGGLGNDTLLAGAGDDWVYGDDDYGEQGDDLIDGGAGHDFLAGQGGDDTVRGGAGNDSIYGGDGDDLLQGGDGDDWISGNAGNDTLIAGRGTDDLDGGDGDDVLYGSAAGDNAWLHGGAGNDTLYVGSGDFGEGGAGNDRFVLDEPGDTVPIIGDYNRAEDVIELRFRADDDEPDPFVTLERGDDGSTLIRLDGAAVGRVLGQTGLRAEDIILTRLQPRG